VLRDDLHNLRRYIGILYLEFQLLGERAETFNYVEVVQDHLAPDILLTIGEAVIVQVLLPTKHLLAEESRSYFV
jgi:hypothetical protein